MTPSFHRFSELFAQLGLPSDPTAIQSFLQSHAPLADELKLEDAAFWSPAQAQLLQDTRDEDADWAEVVDRLDAALRRPPNHSRQAAWTSTIRHLAER